MIYKIKKIINVDKNNTIKMEKNAKTQSLQKYNYKYRESELRDNNKIIFKFWKGIIIVNLVKL